MHPEVQPEEAAVGVQPYFHHSASMFIPVPNTPVTLYYCLMLKEVNRKQQVNAAVLQLIKTHNLLPNRNYILGYHPHGIFCFGAFCNFGTEATGFSKKFPGIRPSLATLAGNFRLPVLRDYLMSGGKGP